MDFSGFGVKITKSLSIKKIVKIYLSTKNQELSRENIGEFLMP